MDRKALHPIFAGPFTLTPLGTTAPNATQRNATQPNQIYCGIKQIRLEARSVYTTRGCFPLHPRTQGPLAFGVAAAFTRDPAPWIKPPSFPPAGEVVIFVLTTESEITLETGTALAGEPLSRMDLRLCADPPCCLRWLANQRSR